MDISERKYIWGDSLQGDYLIMANLPEANLYGADLKEAHLEGANI